VFRYRSTAPNVIHRNPSASIHALDHPVGFPETRLIAQAVNGAKFVPKEFSLMEKNWAQFQSVGDGIAVIVAHDPSVSTTQSPWQLYKHCGYVVTSPSVQDT